MNMYSFKPDLKFCNIDGSFTAISKGKGGTVPA